MLRHVQVHRFDAPPLLRQEILRYAGCPEETADVTRLLDSCLAEALPLLNYAVCWAEYPIPDAINSRDLRRNLSGCSGVIAFAATIGLGLDRLIAKYSRIAPSRAVVLQALGAERIESLCDRFESELRTMGKGLRPRFSPGYGDLPLTAQKEIFAALGCTKHIGVTLNDSLLMSPSKSVTALIGICHGAGTANAKGCEKCTMFQCPFRRKNNEHS